MNVLWRPPADVLESTEMGRFAARNGCTDYEAPQRWSVTDLKGIWQAAPADSVVSRDALAEPRAIDAFVQFTKERGRG